MQQQKSKKYHLSTTLYDIIDPVKKETTYFITLDELKHKMKLEELSEDIFKTKLFNILKKNNIEYTYEQIDYAEQEEFLSFLNKKEAMKFIKYLNSGKIKKDFL